MRKKLFNVISVLVICMLAVLAFVMLTKRIQNKVMFIGGKATIWVLTGSMEDTIPERTYILIKKVKDAENEVEIGDVITFYSTDPRIYGQLNTHRVVDIDRKKGCFITKGDNNPVNDDNEVPYADVVGVYEKNLKFMTVVGRFFATTTGFICTMAVLLVLVCAAYIPDLIKAIKAQQSESKEEEINRRVAEEVERLKRENNFDTEENRLETKENKSKTEENNIEIK